MKFPFLHVHKRNSDFEEAGSVDASDADEYILQAQRNASLKVGDLAQVRTAEGEWVIGKVHSLMGQGLPFPMAIVHYDVNGAHIRRKILLGSPALKIHEEPIDPQTPVAPLGSAIRSLSVQELHTLVPCDDKSRKSQTKRSLEEENSISFLRSDLLRILQCCKCSELPEDPVLVNCGHLYCRVCSESIRRCAQCMHKTTGSVMRCTALRQTIRTLKSFEMALQNCRCLEDLNG